MANSEHRGTIKVASPHHAQRVGRRGELLTPWMNATLVDFYFNVALLSVWIYLRERSKAVAFFWIMVSIARTVWQLKEAGEIHRHG